jgi:hypothetical protein
MQYTVWIVSPPNYLFSRCFDEVALCLCASLRELGHHCEIVRDHKEIKGRVIVLGGHLLPRVPADALKGKEAIIYNLEPISLEIENKCRGYFATLTRHEVWDYSSNNLGELQRLLGVDARHCPVGYHKVLERIPPAEKSIDVLFVGTVNPRRQALIDRLKQAGIEVVQAFASFGEARDALYAAAKIIINMHYYPTRVFQIVRCSYLFANRLCVVSENGLDDALEAPFRNTGLFCEYDEFTEKIRGLLHHAEERERIAGNCYDVFSQMRQVEILRGFSLK